MFLPDLHQRSSVPQSVNPETMNVQDSNKIRMSCVSSCSIEEGGADIANVTEEQIHDVYHAKKKNMHKYV